MPEEAGARFTRGSRPYIGLDGGLGRAIPGLGLGGRPSCGPAGAGRQVTLTGDFALTWRCKAIFLAAKVAWPILLRHPEKMDSDRG
jgi:hypothetical protein